MNHFPISVNLSGKTVYLIGDGPQIRQKAEKMSSSNSAAVRAT